MRWDYPPLDINPVFLGLHEIIVIVIIIVIIIINIIIIIIFFYLFVYFSMFNFLPFDLI